MPPTTLNRFWVVPCLLVAFVASGCAESYKGIVKPVPKLSVLSPELENLTDGKIETYLKADARPVFPTVLAVAKAAPGSGRYIHRYRGDAAGSPLGLEVLGGEEADGWRKFDSLKTDAGGPLVSQVQFISGMLTGETVTLKSLRDAAALLHAPILVAYIQVDSHDEGLNPAGMAYWTFVGLFTVPGNTVGHCTVCQALLVDTRSGFVLATAEGESLREENCLPGAVDIAGPRVEKEARAEAVRKLQGAVQHSLKGLAARSATSAAGGGQE